MSSQTDQKSVGTGPWWHLRLRAVSGQRVPSRVLQILEIQGVIPSEFRFRAAGLEIHLDIIFLAEEAKARRIRTLLQRLEQLLSLVWWAYDSGQKYLRATEIALSLYSDADPGADMDPQSDFWAGAPLVTLDADCYGEAVGGHETEIRLRWTRTHLYFLFVCPYQNLSLRPGAPVLDQPTPELWKHDVAEIFIHRGTEWSREYCEFELSPRGEWLDLTVEWFDTGEVSGTPLKPGGARSARLEEAASRWHGLLCIPADRIGAGTELRVGDRFRVNFFRSQGKQPIELCWQPTLDASFHVPSAFAHLVLAE